MSPNVVLVIGAGASRDLHPGFGLGADLLQEISDRVTDRTSPATPYLSNLLQKNPGIDRKLCEDFVSHLDNYRKEVEYPSIDEFLNEVDSFPEFNEVRDHFMKIGKFMIVCHILGYEGLIATACKNGTFQKDHWINLLCEFIEREELLESEKQQRLKIVTFNYDRNIEHFMIHHPSFSTKKDKVKKFIQNSLLHIYGKVGDLEWQSATDFFEFGEDNDRREKILQKSDAIRLIYPVRFEDEAALTARRWIHDAPVGRICFLGFAFDYVNSNLLALQNFRMSNESGRFIANIFPQKDWGRRRGEASRIRNVHLEATLRYLRCAEFIKEVLAPA